MVLSRSFLVLAVVAVAAGCLHEPSAEEKLADARRDYPETFYVGESFAGLPLTAVLLDEEANGGADYIYGDCDPPNGFDAGGCAPPLSIQNSLCANGRVVVTIFADSDAAARRARAALRPVGRDDAPKPTVALHANPGC